MCQTCDIAPKIITAPTDDGMIPPLIVEDVTDARILATALVAFGDDYIASFNDLVKERYADGDGPMTREAHDVHLNNAINVTARVARLMETVFEQHPNTD